MIDRAQLKMPTASSESMAVMRMLDGDDVDMNLLVRAITLDPVLSSTLIRYANSPLHRRAREVTSVQQAVTALGLRQVRAAAMVAAMRGFAAGHDPTSAMLWEQSVMMSTLARAVALRCQRRLADEAELLGLLCNMGAMVLNTNFPPLYRELATARGDGPLVHDAEREVFGLHRGDLIGELADRFRLPARVTGVLGLFHARQLPQEADGDADRLLAILWVAHYIAWHSPAAANWPREFVPDEIDALMDQLGLIAEDIENLSEDAEMLVAARLAAT